MIIIAPWAQRLRNEQPNPKNYPWWPELIAQLHYPIVQVGVDGEQQLVDDFRKNLSLAELKNLILECDTWISVDSFFQHYAWDVGKPGIVLWGQSNPEIFGHPENINLLKDVKYLRPTQFFLWEQAEYLSHVFVSPGTVAQCVDSVINLKNLSNT
jgi:ADP-heptose:LPS heptosyltransferase